MIKVILFCDENNINQLSVLVSSLLEAKACDTHYTIYVLTACDKDCVKHDLSHAVNHFDKISKIEIVSEEHFKDNSKLQLFSKIAEVLSDEDKVIYLDSNVLVRGDLTEIWKTPMNGNCLLGVYSNKCISYIWDKECESSSFLSEHKEAQRSYIDSETILMDLSAIRESRIFETWRSYDDKLPMMDVINVSTFSHIGVLPLKNNVKAYYNEEELSFFVYQNLYSFSDVDEALCNPAIISFADLKPWEDVCVPKAHEWWEFVFKYDFLTQKFNDIYKAITSIKLSLIMPVYDNNERLKDVIKHVIKCKDYIELIIVKNASLNLAGYNLDNINNIKTIITEYGSENTTEACYFALKYAKGKYIQIIDSVDDIMEFEDNDSDCYFILGDRNQMDYFDYNGEVKAVYNNISKYLFFKFIAQDDNDEITLNQYIFKKSLLVSLYNIFYSPIVRSKERFIIRYIINSKDICVLKPGKTDAKKNNTYNEVKKLTKLLAINRGIQNENKYILDKKLADCVNYTYELMDSFVCEKSQEELDALINELSRDYRYIYRYITFKRPLTFSQR